MTDKMNMDGGLSSAPSSFSDMVDDDILGDSNLDGCSICLEPFTSVDPPSVTKCKHEYHLHCILEWSQRRVECPVCLQHLVLNDPVSQESLAAVESEKNLRSRRTFNPANQDNEISTLVNESDNEQRIMRHFAAIANRARNITRRRRPITPAVSPSQILPSVPMTNMSNLAQDNSSLLEHQGLASCFLDNDSSSSVRATNDSSSSVRATNVTDADMQCPINSSRSPSDYTGKSSPSELVAFSESLKSKISTASIRYKESISKNTRSLKEKLVAHNESVKELSRGVHREMSAGFAGIARMIAQKRAGVAVPSSSSTMGTSNSHCEVTGNEDENISQSLRPNKGEMSKDMSSNPTPLLTDNN